MLNVPVNSYGHVGMLSSLITFFIIILLRSSADIF